MNALRCLARIELRDREAFLSAMLAGQEHDEPYVEAMPVQQALDGLQEEPGWSIRWLDDKSLELVCTQDEEQGDEGAALIQVQAMVNLANEELAGAAYAHFMHCMIGLDEIDYEHARADGEDDDEPADPTEIWERYESNGGSWPVADDS